MNGPINVAIVIPAFNRKEITLACLRRLETVDKTGLLVDIIVVDDNSTDGTPEAVMAEFPATILIHGTGHLWWGGATNLGIEYVLKHERHHYLMTLNDDVEFNNDFLLRMVKTARRDPRNIVCGAICDASQRDMIISAGRFAHGLLRYNFAGHLAGENVASLPRKLFESDIESGYVALFPVRAFLDVGLIDTRYFPHHMGDMDFILRSKKEWYKVIIDPSVLIYTQVGSNYFHAKIVDIPITQIPRLFVDIKSTVNFRTRFFFFMRHTPLGLGIVSFIYFIFRIFVAVIMRLVLPRAMLVKIMRERVKVGFPAVE